MQEVSVIATPPTRRQPIRTFVLPWDAAVAREALLREQGCGGQSFAAIIGFGDGQGDVLLATNIIEAGLDMPAANTILVLGAERFGLAQLHQLRGRVGRGQRRGSAFFMTEPGRQPAAAAWQRLRTLEGHSGLGDGIAISTADLDQRGSGDLFGHRQAGHISVLGAELYQRLLAASLSAADGAPVLPPAPELRVGIHGFIPADYVPETNLRLELYFRLSRLATPPDLSALEEEIDGRFGLIPPPVAALLTLAKLRCCCLQRGIARIDAGPQAVAFTCHAPGATGKLAKALSGHVKDGRALLAAPQQSPREAGNWLLTLLA